MTTFLTEVNLVDEFAPPTNSGLKLRVPPLGEKELRFPEVRPREYDPNIGGTAMFGYPRNPWMSGGKRRAEYSTKLLRSRPLLQHRATFNGGPMSLPTSLTSSLVSSGRSCSSKGSAAISQSSLTPHTKKSNNGKTVQLSPVPPQAVNRLTDDNSDLNSDTRGRLSVSTFTATTATSSQGASCDAPSTTTTMTGSTATIGRGSLPNKHAKIQPLAPPTTGSSSTTLVQQQPSSTITTTAAGAGGGGGGGGGPPLTTQSNLLSPPRSVYSQSSVINSVHSSVVSSSLSPSAYEGLVSVSQVPSNTTTGSKPTATTSLAASQIAKLEGELSAERKAREMTQQKLLDMKRRQDSLLEKLKKAGVQPTPSEVADLGGLDLKNEKTAKGKRKGKQSNQ